MNLFPFLAPLSMGLSIFFSYYLIKYVAKKMGKPIPNLGELMYPMHHKDSKIDKRYRKNKP
tara:strand:- start:2898 stop:3080 length:183 start_codon:yes stop_codon:yes gene_type:complete